MRTLTAAHAVPMGLIREAETRSEEEQGKKRDRPLDAFARPDKNPKTFWYGGMHMPCCMVE